MTTRSPMSTTSTRLVFHRARVWAGTETWPLRDMVITKEFWLTVYCIKEAVHCTTADMAGWREHTRGWARCTACVVRKHGTRRLVETPQRRVEAAPRYTTTGLGPGRPAGLRWHKLSMEVDVAATRNVVLSQHQHEFVESLVASGRYQNASEVLREGLRLLEQQEAEDAAKLVALREAADKGWKDLTSRSYEEVADDNLDDFIGQFGVHAATRTQPAGRWRDIA